MHTQERQCKNAHILQTGTVPLTFTSSFRCASAIVSLFTESKPYFYKPLHFKSTTTRASTYVQCKTTYLKVRMKVCAHCLVRV